MVLLLMQQLKGLKFDEVEWISSSWMSHWEYWGIGNIIIVITIWEL